MHILRQAHHSPACPRSKEVGIGNFCILTSRQPDTVNCALPSSLAIAIEPNYHIVRLRALAINMLGILGIRYNSQTVAATTQAIAITASQKCSLSSIGFSDQGTGIKITRAAFCSDMSDLRSTTSAEYHPRKRRKISVILIGFFHTREF